MSYPKDNYLNPAMQTAAMSTVGDRVYVGSTLGGSVGTDASEIERIIQRVIEMQAGIDTVGDRLRNHADRLYGPMPEIDCGGAGNPQCAGLLGSLHDRLDQLEAAHRYVAEQATRNTTLA